MTRTRPRSSGPGSVRRIERVREEGMRSVGRITRLALAASLALAAAFSAVADVAFPGRSDAAGNNERGFGAAQSSDPGVRIALPPPRDQDGLAPPVAPPLPAAEGGSVTSGGS